MCLNETLELNIYGKASLEIKKENPDGTFEVVWTCKCTQATAIEKSNGLVEQQANELHSLKTISKWKSIRLLDEQANIVTSEL